MDFGARLRIESLFSLEDGLRPMLGRDPENFDGLTEALEPSCQRDRSDPSACLETQMLSVWI